MRASVPADACVHAASGALSWNYSFFFSRLSSSARLLHHHLLLVNSQGSRLEPSCAITAPIHASSCNVTAPLQSQIRASALFSLGGSTSCRLSSSRRRFSWPSSLPLMARLSTVGGKDFSFAIMSRRCFHRDEQRQRPKLHCWRAVCEAGQLRRMAELGKGVWAAREQRAGECGCAAEGCVSLNRADESIDPSCGSAEPSLGSGEPGLRAGCLPNQVDLR